MDALDSVVNPLREFSKDSIRLVKRCHKPNRNTGHVPSTLSYRIRGLRHFEEFVSAPQVWWTRGSRLSRWFHSHPTGEVLGCVFCSAGASYFGFIDVLFLLGINYTVWGIFVIHRGDFV
ncbi:uncharacterized protein LOC116255499 isoform X5 [Nymphaea colorata]|nr:uncharacterized protein LOC116255499 isoform X5 [Nymphaea colorata]